MSEQKPDCNPYIFVFMDPELFVICSNQNLITWKSAAPDVIKWPSRQTWPREARHLASE